MKPFPRIVELRALVLTDGGADYHDQAAGHWIDSQISTPMARYREYRDTRSSFGLNVLGTVVVEAEAENGVVGVGVSTGGLPACFLVERHLSRFVEGQRTDRVELMWDQMWRSTLFYGRKGLALNALSAVDLALWDLLGRLRDEPVCALIGGAVREEIEFYATGPRPISPRNWASSEASCLSCTGLRRGTRACGRTSRRRRRCAPASAMTSSSPTTVGCRSTFGTRSGSPKA